jgi:membrane AbrB-like protein
MPPFISSPSAPKTAVNLSKFPKQMQWASLLIITLICTAFCEWLALPAALLLGPMFAGIITESLGGVIRLPKVSMQISQAVIGCLIARSVNQDILNIFIAQWPVLICAVSSTLVASVALGWGIGKIGILPGTTAIWGLLPGAASVMVVMAEDYGADPRLVAFMQYLRVLLVTVTASLVARFWAHVPSSAINSVIWFAPVHALALAVSIGVICFSLLAHLIPRFSGGVLLLSLILGGFIQLEGYVQLELPLWLLAVAFTLIGWNVGLRFTREVLIVAAKALPQTVFSILLLILFCMGLAIGLFHFLNADPLSAYLGTSPGGVDSAAIIAASTNVDIAFVMALQIMRFLMTLLIGPSLSRYVANLSSQSKPNS